MRYIRCFRSRESIIYILPNSAATQKLGNNGEEEQIWTWHMEIFNICCAVLRAFCWLLTISDPAGLQDVWPGRWRGGQQGRAQEGPHQGRGSQADRHRGQADGGDGGQWRQWGAGLLGVWTTLEPDQSRHRGEWVEVVGTKMMQGPFHRMKRKSGRNFSN